MNVSASTNFKGKLEADPATGIVRVTDAHPAGIYPITVKAFGFMGVTNTRTFTLTVNTPPVCNPVSFAPTVNYGVGTDPQGVTVGDFNGDGKQDLVVANSFTADISILQGNVAGGFGSATNFLTGNGATSAAVADFNGDGLQDLAVASQASNRVSILVGNGAGSFSAPVDLIVGTSPVSVSIGDLNGDSKPDIVVVNANSDNVSALIGDGSGSFSAAVNYAVGAQPRSVAIGDFNSDGKQDLATANYGTNNVSILLGDGFGNLGAPVNFNVGSNPFSVAIGDFDGDGKQDLVTANNNSGNASILLGDGTGNFSSAGNFFVGNNPRSVAVGDFNGDGSQDVAVAKINSNNITILLGNGTGNMSTSLNFSVGSDPWSLAVGDFNGDGKQDLAVVNTNSGNVSILLRDCTISGTVVYGNAIGSPSTRYVSNVQVNAAGTPAASSTTLAPGAGEGTYKLDLLGAGPYTVTPSKTGGVNTAINSFDAARIAAHVTGISLLTGNALVAADVSGNGFINSFDAAQIARFVTSQPPFGNTGAWRFFTIPNIPFPVGSTPTSRTYSTLTSNLSGQDFTAILMGEVSGNWNNTGARSGVSSPHVSKGSSSPSRALTDVRATDTAAGPLRGIAVELPSLVSEVGQEIVVPMRIDNAVNKGIVSYEFNLRYDPAVIQPVPDVVDVNGTVSRGLSFAANANEPGILRVAVYGAMPIDSDGILLNLRFKMVGDAGAVSPLTWQRIMFNDGQPRVSTVNGRVRL